MIGFDREAVIPHPRTGEPILYVSEGHSARFNELECNKCDALLASLFGVLYAPDAVSSIGGSKATF